jgi:hypothetical protein
MKACLILNKIKQAELEFYHVKSGQTVAGIRAWEKPY